MSATLGVSLMIVKNTCETTSGLREYVRLPLIVVLMVRLCEVSYVLTYTHVIVM